jgi:RNA ligase
MINLLRELQSEGWVRGVEHSTLPLIVWNYSPATQFEKKWGDYPILRSCRGLVTDLEGNVISKSFDKFFNWEEHTIGEFPDFSRKLEITEKMDGSLLIVFRYNDQVVYSTRGSFYSDQAIAGGNLFREIYNEDWIEEGYTYLFEYISPDNRIVVSYDKSDLIHLAKIDNSNGLDVERDSRFNCVNVVEIEGDCFSDIFAGYSKLKSLNSSNKEGFVIRALFDGTQPDWRCKIKFDNYIKLHRIVTGVSNKTVWEMLRDGSSIDSMLEICPDEFNDWLKNTKASFELKFLGLESRAKYAYDCVRELPNRKEQATTLISNHKEVSAIVFKMLDGADYSGLIWNMIKPDRFVQPFANKEED